MSAAVLPRPRPPFTPLYFGMFFDECWAAGRRGGGDTGAASTDGADGGVLSRVTPTFNMNIRTRPTKPTLMGGKVPALVTYASQTL